jgi:xylulokinase
MPPPACFLGIDLGTTGIAFMLLDQSGESLAELRRAYSNLSEDSESASPQDWWRATRTGIKELLRRAGVEAGVIRAVGVTGVTEGAVLIGTEGQILTPTSLGASESGQHGLSMLAERIGLRNLHNLTGRHARSATLLPKFLDQSEQYPRVSHELHAVLQPPEFLRFRLTGALATDPSCACQSLLFSARSRTWSKQVLNHLSIDPILLPQVVSAGAIIGRVTDTAARESGLQMGTPVIAGANQQVATAIAVGADTCGDLLLDLGETGTALCLDASYHRGKGHIDTGCFGDLWTLEARGVSPTTGINWLMDTVMPAEVQQARRRKRDPLDHLAEIAAETQPGADGLLFISPESGPASGFIGLRPDHERGHLVRAVFEAGALSVRTLVDELAELRVKPQRLMLTGPGSANPLWCQMVADATEQTVRAFPQDAMAARGVATLAAVASGAFKNLDKALAKGVKSTATLKPRKAATETYHRLRPRRAAIISALDNGAPELTSTAAPAS